MLIAGCGKGHEALFIRRELGGSVVGVDIGEQWDPSLGADVPDFRLLIGSILELPFADGSFDAVFYHHVIEHVNDPSGVCAGWPGSCVRATWSTSKPRTGTARSAISVPSKRQPWRSCGGIVATTGRGYQPIPQRTRC